MQLYLQDQHHVPNIIRYVAFQLGFLQGTRYRSQIAPNAQKK